MCRQRSEVRGVFSIPDVSRGLGLRRQKILHWKEKLPELPQMGCLPLTEKNNIVSASTGVLQSPGRDKC